MSESLLFLHSGALLFGSGDSVLQAYFKNATFAVKS